MTARANECIAHLSALLATVPGLSAAKVLHVYSEEELKERTKSIQFPFVGVVYDGIRAVPEAGDTGKMGKSGQLVVSIMVFFRQNTVASADPKLGAVQLMDDIRTTVMRTKSATGHFWKFQMEVPIEGKTGLLTYLQRWSTPIQLV